MKHSRVCIAVGLLTLTAATARLAAQPAPSPPRARRIPAPCLPNPQAGQSSNSTTRSLISARPNAPVINHVFNVTNTGTEMLIISNVAPGCGCTKTLNWTRQIAPGQAGVIPAQYNSISYPGPVKKNIEVYSNAKNSPHETLYIEGTLWKPIEVNPVTAVMNALVDATNSHSTTVHITVKSDQPVEISNPVSSGKMWTAELKTNIPGKDYALVITAAPPFPIGNSSGSIHLKTTLPSTPDLAVNAIMTVQPEIQVTPNPLRLAGILNNAWSTNRIYIHGNGAAPLALSDPQCTDTNIHVQISTIGAAGMFMVQVALPPNYQIPPGQQVEVSVKSNNPRNPLIKVPLAQLPRPVLPARPTPLRTNTIPAASATAGHS